MKVEKVVVKIMNENRAYTRIFFKIYAYSSNIRAYTHNIFSQNTRILIRTLLISTNCSKFYRLCTNYCRFFLPKVLILEGYIKVNQNQSDAETIFFVKSDSLNKIRQNNSTKSIKNLTLGVGQSIDLYLNESNSIEIASESSKLCKT